MKKLVALVLAITAIPAFAQQQPPDPAILQRAVTALQAQRNQANDVAASWEARAAMLSDDLAKAQARIKELESKKDEK